MTVPVQDDPKGQSVIPEPPERTKEWRPIPIPDTAPGVDQSTMQAFLAFQQAVDLHQRLVMQNISEGGTQPAQITLLRVVATYPGLCQREIADLLGLSRARVTTILQSLESMGAIERVSDSDDQRLARVHLTDLGRDIDAAKEAMRGEHINLVFGSMSEEERVELRRALSAVSRGIRSLVKDDGSGSAEWPARPHSV